MKIQMTEDQFRQIRSALIIAQCECEGVVNDCKASNLNILATLHQSRLNDINAALENTSWVMVEKIEENKP